MGVEKNDGKESNSLKEERFDYLITRYMAREASDGEKGELRQLVEHGFGDRFRERFDADYHTASGTEKLPDKLRREILNNILGHDHKRAGRVIRWRGWAAAILAALGAVVWLTLRSDQQVKEILSGYSAGENENEGLVFRGKQFLYLPDGSSVLMNEGSELSYLPQSFENGSREVALTGEAYFDIASDPESVFSVRTGTVVTRVLGTAFNVNMRQEEVVVTVTRGLVEVSGADGIYAQVKPDEQITVNTGTQHYNTALVKAEEEINWKKAYLVFDNIDLKEAGELIAQYYGIELVFVEAELMKCRITASFLNGEDMDTVLTVLSEMMGASFMIEGNRALIKGGSCT